MSESRTAPPRHARATSWRNVFCVYDDGSLTPDDYAALEPLWVRHATLFPKNAAFLCLIPKGAHPLSESSRRAIVAAYDRHMHLVKRLVWAVEGTGFGPAVVRATLTTIGLARRRYHPCTIAASLEEALATIVVSDPKTSCTAEEMAKGLAVLESLRPPRTASIPPPPKRPRWPWQAAG